MIILKLVLHFIIYFCAGWIIVDTITYYARPRHNKPDFGVTNWLHRNIYWRIRYFFHGVYNIIRWMPTIFHDRDWDHYFIMKLLLVKIRHMRKRFEKIKWFVGWENEVKWMKMCETLIQYNLDSKAWDDEEENKPLNYKNIGFFKQVAKTDNNYLHHIIEQLQETESHNGTKCDLREHKVEELIWKILSWRTPYWWD